MWSVLLAAAAARRGPLCRAAGRAEPWGTRNLFKGGRLQPHMNELPLPCLPWAAYYRERQQYYNKWLCIGVVWCMLSMYLMVMSGSFYLNWAPPTKPAPPLDSYSKCDKYVDTSYDD